MGGSQAADDLIKRVVRYDTIPITSILGIAPSLTNNYRYCVYSRVVDFDYYIHGFSAPFSNVNVQVKITDIDARDAWVPFFTAGMQVFFGYFSQASPILKLPEPYVLPCGHRLQFELQNQTGFAINNAYITVIGARSTQEC